MSARDELVAERRRLVEKLKEAWETGLTYDELDAIRTGLKAIRERLLDTATRVRDKA